MHILVAEDNPLNQRLIEHALQEVGHRATLVSDGHAALAKLDLETFDLVLMDVQMPGLDGLEAVSRLRARERQGARRTPVIALTARCASGDLERCLQAGMDGYLAKPLDLAELERVLERVPTDAGAKPPSPDDDSPYRRAILEHRVGSDAGFLLELSRIFEARAELLIGQIQNAIQAREAQRVQDAAHEFKGMLLNLAATDAHRTARELEAAGRGARYDTASVCLARLVDETSWLLTALRARANSCA